MGDIEEIPIETPIKIKKPRSEKQIEAFQKAIAKKKELSEINKEFNNAKKQQKDELGERKKRIIKTVKEPVSIVEEVEEVEIKKPIKKKLPKPPVIEESSEEEEEVIVKRKKTKKKKPTKKNIYEDTSSDSFEDDEAIVNYAKIIKKTAREKLKEELNQSKLQNAMSSLGYI